MPSAAEQRVRDALTEHDAISAADVTDLLQQLTEQRIARNLFAALYAGIRGSSWDATSWWRSSR